MSRLMMIICFVQWLLWHTLQWLTIKNYVGSGDDHYFRGGLDLKADVDHDDHDT